MGTEIPAFYTTLNSVTPFYREPYSQSTLPKEFDSVDFQHLTQIGIQKINPQIAAFCTLYFYFIRTMQYRGQNCGTMIYVFTLNDLGQ
jgi:hypothetical protein